MNSSNENFDNDTINKAKRNSESYLRSNFVDIKTIEFSDDYSSPMGGLIISGIVNGNKEANFSIDIEVDNNFKIGSIAKGEKFPARKEECKEKSCDY